MNCGLLQSNVSLSTIKCRKGLYMQKTGRAIERSIMRILNLSLSELKKYHKNLLIFLCTDLILDDLADFHRNSDAGLPITSVGS